MNNTTLAQDLLSQLQGAPMQQLASQLGTTPQQATSAVGAALPLLLGTLGRNASQPQGAQALFGALQKDHAGMDLGSVLGAVLGGGGGQQQNPIAAAGPAILGHIFGGNQPRAQQGLGQATGLDSSQATQLLAMRGAGWRAGRPDWRIRRSGPPPAPGCRGGRGGSRRGNV